MLYWLSSQQTSLGFTGSCELQRGTAEKVTNLLVHWDCTGTVGLGSSDSKKNALNDVERVLSLICAQSPRLPVGRKNPRYFQDDVVSSQKKSWNSSINAFLAYIKDYPEWHKQASDYLASISELENVKININAFIKTHVFYALYQATYHENASLSLFELSVFDSKGQFISGLIGWWSWDGSCPGNANRAIEQVYGSIEWAKMVLFDAMDISPYVEGTTIHGFHPVVTKIEVAKHGQNKIEMLSKVPSEWTGIETNALHELLKRNPDYGRSIVNVFHGIPTQPGEGAAFFLTAEEEDLTSMPNDNSDSASLSGEAYSVSPDDDELGRLLLRAEMESNPQERAVLWGMCIEHLLDLEDIQDGLTYEQIRAMSDLEASRLASRMQAVFELREPWKQQEND